MAHDHLALFDTPPDRRQVRFCLAVVGVLFFATLAILPVVPLRLAEVDAFVPVVDATIVVGEVITATLLYAQASIFSSRALAILGTAYLLTALLLIPHTLTFPGVFSRNGWLGAGVNTTAWLGLLRKPAFAIGAILYAHFRSADSTAQPSAPRSAPKIGVHVLAAVVLAIAITLLAIGGLPFLPPIFVGRASVIHANLVGYEAVAAVLWIIAIATLLRRRSSVLEMWLLVALAACLFQSLLNMTNQARFTAGFYWLYLMMLFSNLIVMLVLIAESTRLYARLALSISALHREREARLMSIDALAAAISHEVAQPLTVFNTYVGAGLRSLAGERPDVERAAKAMRAAGEAGSLVVGVIRSLRATFAGRTGERTQFGLADLVQASVPLLQAELASEGISLQLALDETLPPVLADRVQLQRVLVNLLANAIESLSLVETRPRQIVIRSALLESQDVVLEVADNGPGIADEDMARIFDSFFTTKPAGAGLGLSLCRIIVEAHGGRLWASRGEEHGATFHLQLPGSASHTLETGSDYEVGSAA